MATFYEYHTRIGASEAGLLLQCRPSGVLAILQEAATRAACVFHASGPEMLEKYHAIWMVSRIWYRLDRPMMWGDQVSVKTWHRADRGAMLYRDFDLTVNGEPAGEAISAWVLANADLNNRRILRLSGVKEVAASGGGELCKDKKFSRLKLPENMTLADTRRFRYSDADSNGHVNNVHYADAAADALSLEKLLPGHFISSLHLEYRKECLPGETVALYTGASGEERFVRGLDEANESRFDACLVLKPLPEMFAPFPGAGNSM